METTQVVGVQVRRLLGNKSHAEVCDIAAGLGRHLENASTAAEHAGTAEVARALIAEADEAIREVLAQSLSNAPSVPKDVARRIALDLDTVSVPFLRRTRALDEAELAELADQLSEAGLCALAKRPRVGARLAERIVAIGDVRPVTALAGNMGSNLTPQAYDTAIRRFRGESALMRALAERPQVPLDVLERLFTEVSEAVCRHLAEYHGLPDGGRDLIDRANDRAFFRQIRNAPEPNVVEQVSKLYVRGDLKLSTIESALAEGHLLFFEVAMSRMAGVPLETAREMTRRGGTARTFELCRRARVSEAGARKLADLAERALKVRPA